MAKTGTVLAPPYKHPNIAVTAPGSLSAFLDTKLRHGSASPYGRLFAKLEAQAASGRSDGPSGPSGPATPDTRSQSPADLLTLDSLNMASVLCEQNCDPLDAFSTQGLVSQRSLLSTDASLVDVIRDIHIYDKRLSPADSQVGALIERSHRQGHSWPSFTVPAFELGRTSWPSTDPDMDAMWNNAVAKAQAELNCLKPGEMPVGYSTDIDFWSSQLGTLSSLL